MSWNSSKMHRMAQPHKSTAAGNITTTCANWWRPPSALSAFGAYLEQLHEFPIGSTSRAMAGDDAGRGDDDIHWQIMAQVRQMIEHFLVV